MTTDETIRDLERALRNTTSSLNYYEAELGRTSALKPRFKMIQRQIDSLRTRRLRLEHDIQTLKENGND